MMSQLKGWIPVEEKAARIILQSKVQRYA